MSSRLTSLKLHEAMASWGIKWLRGEYRGNDSVLTLECGCGNEFRRRYGNLSFREKERVCEDCAVRRRDEEYRNKLIGAGFDVIAFTASDQPVRLRCTDTGCRREYEVAEAYKALHRKRIMCSKCMRFHDRKTRRMHQSDTRDPDAYALEKLKHRRDTDPQYRIRLYCRGRIYNAFKSQNLQKSETTVTLIGCTIPELWEHLERQFQPGMTRENYGEWVIDHRIPCCAFDLRCPAQQRMCFGFWNLQPLWEVDNKIKVSSDLKLHRLGAADNTFFLSERIAQELAAQSDFPIRVEGTRRRLTSEQRARNKREKEKIRGFMRTEADRKARAEFIGPRIPMGQWNRKYETEEDRIAAAAERKAAERAAFIGPRRPPGRYTTRTGTERDEAARGYNRKYKADRRENDPEYVTREREKERERYTARRAAFIGPVRPLHEANRKYDTEDERTAARREDRRRYADKKRAEDPEAWEARRLAAQRKTDANRRDARSAAYYAAKADFIGPRRPPGRFSTTTAAEKREAAREYKRRYKAKKKQKLAENT